MRIEFRNISLIFIFMIQQMTPRALWAVRGSNTYTLVISDTLGGDLDTSGTLGATRWVARWAHERCLEVAYAHPQL